MINTNIHDKDLNPVLDKANKKELGVLHDIIMTKLSETLSTEDAYKRHYPDHTQYADLIAKEIRDFSGNSITNVYRGKGPPYREIVCDVAKVINAPFSRAAAINEIETSILATILAKAFEKMSEEGRLVLFNQISSLNRSRLQGGSLVAFQLVFNAGGFASYQLMLIVVNAVVKGAIGRGLPFVANAALARVMRIATGPVGWALTSILAVIQIPGPSYKVTIPGVAYIAMLRKSQDALHCAKCLAVVDGGFRFCPECGEEIVPTP